MVMLRGDGLGIREYDLGSVRSETARDFVQACFEVLLASNEEVSVHAKGLGWFGLDDVY